MQETLNSGRKVGRTTWGQEKGQEVTRGEGSKAGGRNAQGNTIAARKVLVLAGKLDHASLLGVEFGRVLR